MQHDGFQKQVQKFVNEMDFTNWTDRMELNDLKAFASEYGLDSLFTEAYIDGLYERYHGNTNNKNSQ